MTAKADRLAEVVHMLNLLPYFEAHPGISLMEASKDLGRSPKELMDDLNSLWCCGLPGLFPGDLVDLDHTYKSVKVTNAQGMDKPLRLTHTEAGALLLALESLENLPGLTNREVVQSAAAKLRGIMGDETTAVVDSIVADTVVEHTSPLLDAIRRSLDHGLMLRFTYYSARSDSSNRRTVHPARVFSVKGDTYLAAWDDEAQAHRTFKVDRMSDVEVLDTPSTPHAEDMKFDEDDPFAFGKETDTVSLEIHPDVLWLADYVPLELGETDPDGWVAATMPMGSPAWVVRFAIGQAGRVRVTAPEEVTRTIAAQAEAALGAYSKRRSMSGE